MKIKMALERKPEKLTPSGDMPTNIQSRDCIIEKTIQLNSDDFSEFCKKPCKDYGFIKENNHIGGTDEQGNTRCLLVMNGDTGDGAVVNPEGYNYARYASFIPNIREFIVKQNQAYIDEHAAEFEDTKFYFNDNTERVTMVYYNPDSEAGGQLVSNELYLCDLKETLTERENLEEFWELFYERAGCYLTDIDAAEFESAARHFVEEPCDIRGQSRETIAAIREWASKMEQANVTEQSQSMTM
jgi:hypothetical protein